MSYYPGQPGAYPGAYGAPGMPQQAMPGYGAPAGYPGAAPYGSGAYGGPAGVNPGQGNAAFAFPPGQAAADPLWAHFSQVAGADGQIDAEELQRCLAASGVAGPYSQFSVDTARLMILMLDRDMSGTMGFEEFKQLWAAIQMWQQTFQRFDRDRSGTIETNELHEAIRSYGFNISPRAAEIIARRYSRKGKSSVSFDDFIACSAKLRFISESFRRRDPTGQSGFASLSYDDFIQFSMAI